MGVSRFEQVANNVAALDLFLPPAHLATLDAISGEAGKFLYGLFNPTARNQIVFGQAEVTA